MGTANLKRRNVVEYCSRQRVIKEDDTDVIDAQSPIWARISISLFLFVGLHLGFLLPPHLINQPFLHNSNEITRIQHENKTGHTLNDCAYHRPHIHTNYPNREKYLRQLDKNIENPHSHGH